MRAHKLKTWPAFFDEVKRERKHAEVRNGDRDFQVGDYLMLVEFDPREEMLTGRYECRRISHILTAGDPPRGLLDGFVVLSMETCGGIDESRLLGQYNGLIHDPVEWLKPLDQALTS